MAKVDVDISVNADVAKVWVDGTQVRLTDGEGTAKVEPDAHHALTWAVRGAPGTRYTVKITAPKEARLDRGDTFDNDEFDAGLAWFKVLVVLLLLCAAAPAFAQGRDPVTKAVDAAALTKATTVGSDSPVDVAAKLTFEGSSKDKVATGQVGFLLGDFALTLAASAPINSDTGAATLADLDGLKSKANGSVKLLWQHWSINDVGPALAEACGDYAAAAGKNVKAIECGILALKKNTTPEGREALSNILERVKPGTLYFLGGGGKVAPEKFDFVGKSDLTGASERHISWSASAYTGLLLSSGVMLAGTYTREVAYRPGDKSQICRPAALPGALECGDEVIGGPGAAHRTNQVSVEIRTFFGDSFAISPRGTYDVAKKATGLALPLYFMKAAEGGIRGGITIGWRSDTKAVTASVSVGQVLGLVTN
jgi:hypothetical protein